MYSLVRERRVPDYNEWVRRDFTADTANRLCLNDIERHEAFANPAVVKGHHLNACRSRRRSWRTAGCPGLRVVEGAALDNDEPFQHCEIGAGSASETESTVRNQRLNVPQVSTPTLNLADVGSDRIADLPSPLGWVPIPSKGSRVPVDPDREGDDHDHQTGSAPDRARRRLMHQTRRWYQQPGLCTLSEQQPHCRISFVSFLTRGSTSDWR